MRKHTGRHREATGRPALWSERERQRDRQRETEGERDRQRERETDLPSGLCRNVSTPLAIIDSYLSMPSREKQRERSRERERERERETERERERERERDSSIVIVNDNAIHIQQYGHFEMVGSLRKQLK